MQNTINIPDLLAKLPDSWKTFKLKDFKKVQDIVIIENKEFGEDFFDGIDNTLSVISSLTDVPVDQLEDLPYGDILKLGKRIDFISEMPRQTETSIKWKDIESITYNDFMQFIALAKEPLKNLSELIKTFNSEGLTPEQIEQLSIQDCMAGFFLLVREYRKSVKCSVKSLERQVMKEKLKKMLPFKLNMQSKDKSSKSNTVGSS